MIQDIQPHKLENHYRIHAKPTENSPVYFFNKEKELLAHIEDEELRLPTLKEFQDANAGAPLCEEDLVFLFALDQTEMFLCMNKEAVTPEGCSFVNMRKIRYEHGADKTFVFPATTAYQLSNWYTDNRYCGTCGSRMRKRKTERAVECPECGRIVYPRILPAVIVAVTDGDKIVLTRYRGRGFKFFALIAGFTEIGETLEETVQREVMEEVGLEVENIRYYKSQPWGIDDDILMGFYCNVKGSRQIRLDREELKEGLWVQREEIELQPDDYSLTNEMMTLFKQGKEPR